MIKLITGLPGHGKTLWTVAQLLALVAKDPARPVYVHGVRGLTVPHLELEDGREWQSCPDGSLIVIDECQTAFPTRGNGTPPDHVAKLSTHRHRGIDIWLITQHPGNIDSYVRERLIEEHVHVMRMMGVESAMVYTWTEVQSDPRGMAARKAALTTPWPYPKDVYGAYSSAVLHTAKARIPWRKFAVIALALFAPVLIYFAVASLPGSPLADDGADGLSAVSAAQPTAAQVSALPPIRTPEEWLAQFTPRVPSRPESAPAYDKIMQTGRPPQLYCIDVEFAGCRCYTDQGTLWEGVPEPQCQRLARYGTLSLQDARSNRRG